MLLIDCRSFIEFNQSNIVNSINVCCNKIVKRRLQTNKVSLLPLIPYLQVDNVGNDWLAQDMLGTFPPCNLSLDYPEEIFNQNYIPLLELSVSGISKIIDCGILINAEGGG